MQEGTPKKNQYENLTELELEELPDRRRCSSSEPWCCCPVPAVTPAAVVAPVGPVTPAAAGCSAIMSPVVLGAELATPVICTGLPNSSVSWTGYPCLSVRWIGFPLSSFKSAIVNDPYLLSFVCYICFLVYTILICFGLEMLLRKDYTFAVEQVCVYIITCEPAWLGDVPSLCEMFCHAGIERSTTCVFYMNTSRIRHNNV